MAVRGWIVSVTYVLDGAEVVQRYDVAISAPDDALAAVRQLAALGSSATILVEEQLFDATFFGLGLMPGEIRARVLRRK
jgi:hypothetical protein